MRRDAKRPVAAVGVVVVHDGRVLLVRRGRAPNRGRWTLPGGAVEWGESARAAAAREVAEECGLDVAPERILDVVDLIARDDGQRARYHYVIVEWLARWRGGRLRAGSDADDARWVAGADLDAYGLSEDARRLIRSALAG